MGYDLVVLGDLVADLVVPIERLPLMPNNHGWAEGIFVEPGGAGNVLVAARRLNLAVAALGHVGADRYGREMLDMLAAQGVSPDRNRRLPGARHGPLHGPGRRARPARLPRHQGRPRPLALPRPLARVIAASRALYTDGYTLRDILAPDDIFAAFASARAAGTPSFFDPGPSVEFIPRDTSSARSPPRMSCCSTEAEAAWLIGEQGREEAARALLALGATTVVLKLGADGCLVATSAETIHVPAFPVEVVDTVGAGDSFAPAFIAGWIRGGDLRACATLANAMGALAATQRGAGHPHPPPRTAAGHAGGPSGGAGIGRVTG